MKALVTGGTGVVGTAAVRSLLPPDAPCGSFRATPPRTPPASAARWRRDQPFQPLWADDLGAALALAVTRQDLKSQVLLLAGPEVTTTHDILDRLARLTGQNPVRIPIPSALTPGDCRDTELTRKGRGLSRTRRTSSCPWRSMAAPVCPCTSPRQSAMSRHTST